jgi:hypothetical protein
MRDFAGSWGDRRRGSHGQDSRTFEGIREKRLYIMTHPEHNADVRARMERILAAGGG